MRVLVTGGAGYVGSHALRRLRERGHHPVVYDNLSTGHRRLAQGFDCVWGELADRERLAAALRGVDAVMHFAACSLVAESVADPRKYFENNVVAGLGLLRAVVEANIKLFILSSSCAVYGLPAEVPIPETAPRLPENPYGATKLALEQALEAYRPAYGLRYAALRYFNAAGADESGEIGELHAPETHLIPRALEAVASSAPFELYGADYATPDGTCIRDYIHVNDLAEAHALALDYLQRDGTVAEFNLGSGQGCSVREVLAAVEKVTGCPLQIKLCPRRAGDPPALVADARRARDVLAWRPTRTLEDMVRTAWQWFQSHAAEPARFDIQ